MAYVNPPRENAMRPFIRTSESKMNFRRIDENFPVIGQITPAQVEDVAAAGFKSILCARPDMEEPGQPGFGLIEQAAEKAGLKAVHIPVSGQLSEGALIRMELALEDLPSPMLGYCRSGARAGSLYNAIQRSRA
jgi:uncharacterized protein (TIGR01244 family)